MGFDIKKFKNKAHLNNRYEQRIQAIKNSGKETGPIEKAVDTAIQNINDKNTRSFVIYGEPQSGKTEMMTALTAKLLDEGYKIIIHLLQDNVSLLEQNLYRFQNSGLAPAPCNYTEILDSVIDIGDKEWVIFCKKNSSNLTNLIEKLGHIDGKIIIDDEADYATPNSKINQKKQSKINELITSLLGEKGLYIGVTATPARLDLNNTFENDHERWVDFPPHPKYSGQDLFFPLNHEYDKFNLKLIPDNAGDEPKYLREALFGFLVNVAYLNLHPKIHNGPQNYSFLIHTSGQKADHKKDYKEVQKVFGTLSDQKHKYFDKYVEKIWSLAYSRYPNEADQITDYTLSNIGCRSIVVMNSAKEFESKHKSATSPSTTFTIVIGGNIVSRGMTFDNLLSMYFTRDVKHKIQQDTYIQRARMFGTRDYLPYFELTIPESLYSDWHRCFVFHRLALEAIRSGKGAPVWLESKRISAAASSSIDKANVGVDAGEMSFGIFDYNSAKDKMESIISSDTENFSKLENLHQILGEEHFPAYVLSYIQEFMPLGDNSIMIHPSHSIAESEKGTDQQNISRKKGFMGGKTFTANKHIPHHLRISYNAEGKARLFYKYSGGIKFLKNLKTSTHIDQVA